MDVEGAHSSLDSRSRKGSQPDNAENEEETVSPEQLEEFQAAFRLFDKDGDGIISTYELGVIMRSVGQNPTNEEIQNLVDEVDIDGNGTVDFHEFLDIMIKQVVSKDIKVDVEESFSILDPNKTGYISVENFRMIMMNQGDRLTEEEVEDMINDVDPQRTGKISCEDFLQMLAS